MAKKNREDKCEKEIINDKSFKLKPELESKKNKNKLLNTKQIIVLGLVFLFVGSLWLMNIYTKQFYTNSDNQKGIETENKSDVDSEKQIDDSNNKEESDNSQDPSVTPDSSNQSNSSSKPNNSSQTQQLPTLTVDIPSSANLDSVNISWGSNGEYVTVNGVIEKSVGSKIISNLKEGENTITLIAYKDNLKNTISKTIFVTLPSPKIRLGYNGGMNPDFVLYYDQHVDSESTFRFICTDSNGVKIDVSSGSNIGTDAGRGWTLVSATPLQRGLNTCILTVKNSYNKTTKVEKTYDLVPCPGNEIYLCDSSLIGDWILKVSLRLEWNNGSKPRKERISNKNSF